ncbi:MAG: Secretion system C-terminal sorting domain, partial [Bacteroidota bacterium]
VPASNVLNIAYGSASNERASFRIYSIDGKVMMAGDWTPNGSVNVQTLDISNLASGIYTVEVISGSFRNTGRFSVSK